MLLSYIALIKLTCTYLCHFSDLTFETAIINQNLGAKLNSLGQLAIVGGDASSVTLDSRVNNNLVGLSSFELDWLAFLKGTSKHGWALSVEHDGERLLLPLMKQLR